MTIGTNAVGAAFGAPSATKTFALGTQMPGADGKRYVYVQASGAIAANLWAAVDENFQAVAGTSALADDQHLIGITEGAFADDDFGWVVLQGSNILATFDGTVAVDIAQLYTSSTAGMLSGVTSGAKIGGVVNVTATSTTGQTAEVIMTYPHWTGASN